MTLPPLDPASYRDILRRALDEDLSSAGDITTDATVPAEARARGQFLVKAACVLAGLDVAAETFRMLEPAVQFAARKADGDRCEPGDIVADVIGSARTLLTGERMALNFLQQLSGVATIARRFVDAAGGRIVVLDTRKTTPGLRLLEKYAVRAGGATNHRVGLFDAILIKDNHIRVAGGVTEAIRRARASRPGMAVEVEAETLSQVDEALAAGAETILVDNMEMPAIREAVARVAGRAKVELSGGVTLARVPELASTGADFVSVGALTHSAPAVDISFEIELLG
jgi:nicotinate-nucleotide pyrophosphorylase (carboxylating)